MQDRGEGGAGVEVVVVQTINSIQGNGSMLKRALMLAAVLAVGGVGTANAWVNNSACAGGNFVTCASVDLSWSGNVVTLKATNLGPGNWRLVGLVNLAMSPGSWTVSAPTNWVAGGQMNDFDPERAITTALSGNTNSLVPGGPYEWVFTFTNLTAAQVDQMMQGAEVAIHAISGPEGCSSRIAIGDGYAYGNDPLNPECTDEPPFTEIPEPATMVLLATGLIGLAGAQFRRRRNGKV